MSEFKPGEIVDITIKGARITEVGDIALGVALSGGRFSRVPLDCEDVTVERVAPAEWPPRPGDLWRDPRGNVWFAADHHDPEATTRCEVFMLASHEDHQVVPGYCNEKYGPLTLVHREDEQDGGRSDG